MASYKESREKLQRLRDQYRGLQQRQYLLRQKINALSEDADDADFKDKSASANKQDSLALEMAGVNDELKQKQAEINLTLQEFQGLGESQKLIENLDDGIPFLLMPLRVETRFVTVKHVTRNFDRADVFDLATIAPSLQPATMENGTIIEISELASFKADGNQAVAQQIENQIAKGAFVPGKGQWLPRLADRRELWVRIFPDDIFVSDHEVELRVNELEAGHNYWNTIWKVEKTFRQSKNQTEQAAKDRRQSRLNAWKTLQQRFQTERSKWIVQATQPVNFSAADTDYDQSPQFPDLDTKAASWTQAAKAFVLPDNFIVRLYSGNSHREVAGKPVDQDLTLGLDPENDEFEDAENVLSLPEKLRWISDFEVAETSGMAIKIPLSEQEFSKGFDRLVVLGVCLSVDEKNAQSLLEQLFYNHQYRPDGLSLLPQGTPTNNTEGKRSGENIDEEEQEAYLKWSESGLFKQEAHDDRRCDGQCLIEALGINDDVFQRVLNSDGEDVAEALAMNRLLWPATMGYFLRQFLSPLINEANLENTRDFFTQFVSGRGLIPCLRVGNQPYGVLPTTVFSRLQYDNSTAQNRYYQTLYQRILKNLDKHWQSLSARVINVADPITHGNRFSDRLMQLLGLHGSSVDFYVRTMVDPFFSMDVMPMSVDNEMDDDYWKIMNGLREMGFHFEGFEEPSRIFDMLYSQEIRQMDGPLIDHLPLSEKRKIQALPNAEQHYLQWLASSDVLEYLKPETLELDDSQGLPLLYLLLRHGVIREYLNTAATLLKEQGIISPVADIDQEREDLDALGANHEYTLRIAIQLKWQFAVMDKVEELYRDLINNGFDDNSISGFEQSVTSAFEFFSSSNYIRDTVIDAVKKLRQRLVPQPTADNQQAALSDFVNDVEEAIQIVVEKEFQTTINGLQTIHPDKWKLLSERYPQVSGEKTMLAFINDHLKSTSTAEAFQYLSAMKTAFEIVKDLPTARLERLLVEHIDCCNYRLDAWMLGLVNQRLLWQRSRQPKGIYLGAYGYLEDIQRGLIEGVSVQEIIKQTPVDFNGNQPVVNEICVPVFNFKTFNGEAAELDRTLKNGYVYLGGQANTSLNYDANTKRIVTTPRIDNRGEGFLHTPSLAHANTAAILRSGYSTYNRDAANPSITDPLAVNLSSHRVRKALYYLEGIRNGQELGALLGYQFERALHDYADKTPLNVSFVSSVAGYLLNLRKHFPLQTFNREDSTDGNENVFCVVDGRALLTKFQEHKKKTHWSLEYLPNCPPAHRQLLDLELKKLESSLDALSDVLMAESVYQMVKGNPERSAAAMRTLNEGGKIDNPEIIQTPQRGFSYLQRIAILLPGDAIDPIAWNSAASPRALLNPQLNQWLGRQLPSPSTVIINVQLEDSTRLMWALSKSGLQPIDLVYLVHEKDSAEPNGEFIVRIKEQILIQESLTADTLLTVDFRDKTGFTDNQISISELLPLLESLASLLGFARPMFPEDLVLPSEAAQGINNGEVMMNTLEQEVNHLLAESGEFSLHQQLLVLQNLLPVTDQVKVPQKSAEQHYDKLYRALLEISFYGVKDAVPSVDRQFSKDNLSDIQLQSENVIQRLEKIIKYARSLRQNIASDVSPRDKWESLREISRHIFGHSFNLFPAFKLIDAQLLSNAIDRTTLKPEGQEFIVEDWLQGVCLVREQVKAYSQLATLREAFNSEDQMQGLQIIQLPDSESPWVASNLPGAALVNGDTLSLALEVEAALQSQNSYVGLVIDEWYEQIPESTLNTGVAFNYNQPDCEAPQTLLLAVSPHETGKWQWDDLIDTINETMDMAKKRAVDPELLKDSILDNFLPTVTGPINDQELVPSVDFARNIKLNTGEVNG